MSDDAITPALPTLGIHIEDGVVTLTAAQNTPPPPPSLTAVQALIDRLDREDRAKLRPWILARYEDDGSEHRRVHDIATTPPCSEGSHNIITCRCVERHLARQIARDLGSIP